MQFTEIRMAKISTDNAIERFLATGEHDHTHAVWPGNSVYEKCVHGDAELTSALIAEVQRRAAAESARRQSRGGSGWESDQNQNEWGPMSGQRRGRKNWTCSVGISVRIP